MTSNVMRVLSAACLLDKPIMMESPVSRAANSAFSIPGREQHASFWTYPDVHNLCESFGLKSVAFDQGCVGAETQKSTELCYSACLDEHVAPRFAHLRTSHRNFNRSLLELDSNNKFTTAQSQHYPPRLNQLLAECFLNLHHGVRPASNPHTSRDSSTAHGNFPKSATSPQAGQAAIGPIPIDGLTTRGEAVCCPAMPTHPPSFRDAPAAAQPPAQTSDITCDVLAEDVHEYRVDAATGPRPPPYSPLCDALSVEMTSSPHASHVNPDSGCVRDVEDVTGAAGFISEPVYTNVILTTGTNERVPIKRMATHRQYLVTDTFDVITDVRPNVLMAEGTKFNRCLWSPEAAAEQRGITTAFSPQGKYISIMRDGRIHKVSFLKDAKGYRMERFLDRDPAMRAAKQRRLDAQQRVHALDTQAQAGESNNASVAAPAMTSKASAVPIEEPRYPSLTTAELWHRRMGHRPAPVMQLMHEHAQDYTGPWAQDVKSHVETCDVCPASRMKHRAHKAYEKNHPPRATTP